MHLPVCLCLYLKHPRHFPSCSESYPELQIESSKTFILLHSLVLLSQIRPKDDQEHILSDLSAADMESVLDVRPYMQKHPYTVAADASMSRAYRLFRTMGLRHMFVTAPKQMVRQEDEEGGGGILPSFINRANEQHFVHRTTRGYS